MKDFIIFVFALGALAISAWVFVFEIPGLKNDVRKLEARLSGQEPISDMAVVDSPSGGPPPPNGNPHATPLPGSTATPPQSSPSVAPLPTPPTTQPQGPQSKKQKQTALYDKYVQDLEAIDDKRRNLERNDTTSQAKIKALKAKIFELEDSFKEHRMADITDEEGNSVGTQNRGTRTSDADRQKQLKPLKTELEYYEKLSAAVVAGYDQIRNDVRAVERIYAKQRAEIERLP